MAHVMQVLQPVMSTLSYLIETEPGSFVDTVPSVQQPIYEGETNSDLHVHPFISSQQDFQLTLEALVKHNFGLCAITTHGKPSPAEQDFWGVKKFFEDDELAKHLDYDDLGKAFQVTYQGKTLTFVGAYEMYVLLPGVHGTIDIVSLMPNQGFEHAVEHGLEFEEYLTMNNDYGAIIIGAHPYTIWDPYGPFGLLRFRLATEEDRKRITDNFFPLVVTVDLVSSNCLWMIKSNALLQQDYPGKPLANSDAHAFDNYTRSEIGRSGNIFELEEYRDGDQLREQLRQKITSNHFTTYHNHSPLFRFLSGIVINQPPEHFP